MSDHVPPEGPPPFPGRRNRYRYSGSRRPSDWQSEWLGKEPGQSWSQYLGVDPGLFRKGGSRWRQEDPMASQDPLTRSPNPHRLYRNVAEGKIAGVCAGIADYINVDSWMVRLGALLGLFFFTPVFFIGYVALWWILKPRPGHLFETVEEEQFWRSVSTRPEQTAAALKAKFRDLDREIARLEGYIASREYDLNRQFRDLERK
ncbi:envelope stress response membrane protein PspC [Oleisolibacter albus]|uniref:envelope stress response membrane protein PspC n=1 Tax=Oleisolibacter albus TaxID=2171757 RepID=UPI000DF3F2CD|nr:envelope stress response membrane protein PspC [Oleisolibacter albus]